MGGRRSLGVVRSLVWLVLPQQCNCSRCVLRLPTATPDSSANGGRDRDRTCDPYHVKVLHRQFPEIAGHGAAIYPAATPGRRSATHRVAHHLDRRGTEPARHTNVLKCLMCCGVAAVAAKPVFSPTFDQGEAYAKTTLPPAPASP
jgi:hypothetical protein